MSLAFVLDDTAIVPGPRPLSMQPRAFPRRFLATGRLYFLDGEPGSGCDKRQAAGPAARDSVDFIPLPRTAAFRGLIGSRSLAAPARNRRFPRDTWNEGVANERSSLVAEGGPDRPGRAGSVGPVDPRGPVVLAESVFLQGNVPGPLHP